MSRRNYKQGKADAEQGKTYDPPNLLIRPRGWRDYNRGYNEGLGKIQPYEQTAQENTPDYDADDEE